MQRSSILNLVLLTTACLLSIGLPNTAAAAPRAYSFTEFDVPLEDGEGTSAFGINNKGAIVGNFFSVAGSVDAFIFEKGGFTYVSPGTGFFGGSLDEINDAGDAVSNFGVGDG